MGMNWAGSTMHAHPGLVAVRAGIPDSDGRRAFSSGLLIAPRLVLTARHGVARDGASLPGVEVSFAAGPRGELRLTKPLQGTVAWLGPGGLDAALIELPDVAPARGVPGTPVRDERERAGSVPAGFLSGELIWGQPAGTLPLRVTVTGMPGFAAAATGEQAEVETVRGYLEPGSYTASNRYAMNLDSRPASWRDWRGVSGSAMTCTDGGYLLGVVAWADQTLEGRRLTAVPVCALLDDPGFRAVLEEHLGHVPEAEPAELIPLLSRPRSPGSPGALLRADAGLTEFAGRDDELAALEEWRDTRVLPDPDVAALLVAGRGGEGKTRLAIEFLHRSKRAGWAAGLLRQAISPERAEVAAHPGQPLLLVIDYAAAHSAGTVELLRNIVQAKPTAPVRLLLLARSGGYWWADLAAKLSDLIPGLEEQVLPLGPLLMGSGPDPAAMFTTTAAALAPHAARFARRMPAELRQIAQRLPVPDLSDARYQHALTIQMAALAALLEAAARGDVPAAGGQPIPQVTGAVADPERFSFLRSGQAARADELVEDTLLRHEAQYRESLAIRRGLDDVRLRRVRDRAVAGAALFGARGRTEPDARQAACALVGAAIPALDGQLSEQREIAAWIADLYPPDRPEPGQDTEYWGTVLPDRLGEFLAIRLLAAEETSSPDDGLLRPLTGRSDPTGVGRALLILSRAVEHDSRAASWIDHLVSSDPVRAGAAALLVAAYAENPAPLRTALVRLGKADHGLLRQAIATVIPEFEDFSLRRLESSVGLTRELVAIYAELAADRDSSHLLGLGLLRTTYSLRLAEAGRQAEALTQSAEALAIYREFAAGDPETYLPALVSALTTHAGHLTRNRQQAVALVISEEAVRAARDLSERDRDALLPDLAGSLGNYAVALAEAGRRAEALSISAESVAAYRQLADADRDSHLPGLAAALNNHAIRLGETDRQAGALTMAQEAVALRRELATGDRDAYLPDLARSLNNLGRQLTDIGRPQDAIAFSAEAVALRRELTEVSRDAFLRDLATSLANYSRALHDSGRHDDALPISGETVTIYRELAEIDPGAYLPELAMMLNNHANLLARCGRRDDALGVSLQAITAHRELAANNRSASLPGLVMALSNHAYWMTENGRPGDALPFAREAVAFSRQLVAADSHTSLRGLVMGLRVLGYVLAANGLIGDAVTTFCEAMNNAAQLRSLDRETLMGSIRGSLRDSYRANGVAANEAFLRATGVAFPENLK